MAAAVIKAYSGIASKQLRAAVVDEIRRVRDEHPEYTSWGHKDVGPALSKIMGKDGSAEVPYTDQIPVPITNGQTVPITNRIGNPDPVPISNTQTVHNTEPVGYTNSVPIPSTYTSTSTPAPLEGYVSTEGHQGDGPDPNASPPPHCPKHPGGTDRPCRACGDARERAEAWERDRRADAEARRQAFLAELDACPDCDIHGWALDDDGTPAEPAYRCRNHNWETSHA